VANGGNGVTRYTLHPQRGAPGKPAPGEPCNGCGLCCLLAPCPLGIIMTRRLSGACECLVWRERQGNQDGRYICGALTRWTGTLMTRLTYRWIAAGKGCDAHIAIDSTPPDTI
jgi:hypothetical protein